MYKRKLQALDYMKTDSFNVLSTSDFRELVVWLEDQKIRHYPIEERADLRQTDSPNWENTFQKYLNHVACPVSMEDRKGVCDWLLGLAVRLEYGDNVNKYKNITAESVRSRMKNVPQIVQANPLDNLDFESADFKAGVMSLAKLLKVTPHPDHLVTLRAVCTVVKKYLSAEALRNAENKKKKEGKPLSLEENNLGFETNDPVLDRAAKILRLLYIHDLRELQTRINETIVAVQTITANPKTDTRLGKVGR